MTALERNRGEVFDRFRQISRRFDAPIWDYSDSPICLQREYFYNSQHLNEEGAAVFSAELATRLAQWSMENGQGKKEAGGARAQE